MITYNMIMTVKIEGQDFEFHKSWASTVTLRKGDLVYINGLEDVLVEKVTFYLDQPKAFVELKTMNLEGKPEEWTSIYDDMDFSVTDLVPETEKESI